MVILDTFWRVQRRPEVPDLDVQFPALATLRNTAFTSARLADLPPVFLTPTEASEVVEFVTSHGIAFISEIPLLALSKKWSDLPGFKEGDHLQVLPLLDVGSVSIVLLNILSLADFVFLPQRQALDLMIATGGFSFFYGGRSPADALFRQRAIPEFGVFCSGAEWHDALSSCSGARLSRCSTVHPSDS